MQSRTVQCNTVQCNTVQCSKLQCSAVHYTAVQCNTVQCSTLQCSVEQCSAIQCNTDILAVKEKTGCIAEHSDRCNALQDSVRVNCNIFDVDNYRSERSYVRIILKVVLSKH